MKKNSIYIVIIGLFINLTSCYKRLINEKVEDPSNFNVSSNANSFHVGDTVTFNFSGTADQIVFYSGEVGSQYSNINRYFAQGANKLVFRSAMQQGNTTNKDSLLLLITPNLGNRYDSTAIVNATWTDITARNTKWPTKIVPSIVDSNYTRSDSIDITDFSKYDALNLAFRFIGKAATGVSQRKWTIDTVKLFNQLSDGSSYPLFSSSLPNSVNDFRNAGWVEASLDISPITASSNAWNVGTWNVSSKDSLRNRDSVQITGAYPLVFNPGSTSNPSTNDDWIISAPVNLKSVKPDMGKVIKVYTSLNLSNYKYIFNQPGTYTVTFVGINMNVSESKKVVRQLKITVNP